MSNFDLANYSPHPPGYILFVLAARSTALIFPDGNSAYLVVALIAQVVALLLTLNFLRSILPPYAAFFGTLAVLFHPLFWYYGSVTSIYTIEAAAVLLVCWAVLRYDGAPSNLHAFALGAIWGLSGGVRHFTMLFVLPAIVYVILRHRRWSEVRLVAAGGILAVMLWFVPLLVMAGGWTSYQTVNSEFFSYYLRTQSPLLSGDLVGGFYNVIRFLTAIAQLVWPLAPLIIVVLFLRVFSPVSRRSRRVQARFWAVLIAAPTLFYLLIHMGQAGYVLGIMVPTLILLVTRGTMVNSPGAARMITVSLALSALIGASAFLLISVPKKSYVAAPDPTFYSDTGNWKTIAAKLLKYQADFSLSGIRAWEGTTKGYLGALREFPTDSTLVIYIRDREVSSFLWEYYTPDNPLLYRRWPANSWTYRGGNPDEATIQLRPDSTAVLSLGRRIAYLYVIDDQSTEYSNLRMVSDDLSKWGKSPIVVRRNESWAGDGLRVEWTDQ